jgi:hypothetical protein
MDDRGTLLKRVDTAELCIERIRALSVSRDRGEPGQT